MIPGLFYPLPDKYISFSERDNRFPIVAGLLKPILDKKEITIIDLEGGSLNFRQNAHALQGSMCHIGLPGINAELAAQYGTPLVEVKNQLPEEIVNQVLVYLGAEERVGLKTLFLGPNANQFQVEFVPNMGADYRKLQTGSVIVRMDVVHNEQILAEFSAWRQEPFALYVKRLPADLSKVSFIRYYIGEKYNKEELMRFAALAVHKEVVYTGKPEFLSKVRRDLRSPHDFPIIFSFSAPDYQPKETDKFSTKKVILSAGNVYASMWHAKVGIPGTENVLVGRAAKAPEFLESLNFFHIFE